MSSLLHNLALVEHVDDVGMLNRAEAMCNSDRCAPLGSRVESVLDDAFRRRVERRGGFVEQAGRLLEGGKKVEDCRRLQDFGIAEQSACNGDALTLATGEQSALCADKSVEAVRKRHLMNCQL
jgi:hypothetical protein